MRKFIAMALFSTLLAMQAHTADAPAKQHANSWIGSWAGNWQGEGGAGRFDMKIESSGENVSGGVSVGADTGDYTATFSALTLDGNKLSAKYDFPPDPQGEIVLVATLEDNKISGTWVLQPKGQDAPLANGTWTVTKK